MNRFHWFTTATCESEKSLATTCSNFTLNHRQSSRECGVLSSMRRWLKACSFSRKTRVRPTNEYSKMDGKLAEKSPRKPLKPRVQGRSLLKVAMTKFLDLGTVSMDSSDVMSNRSNNTQGRVGPGFTFPIRSHPDMPALDITKDLYISTSFVDYAVYKEVSPGLYVPQLPWATS